MSTGVRIGVLLAIAIGSLALIWGILWRLTRHWEKQIARKVQDLDARLAYFRHTLGVIQSETKRYPSNASPPYSPFSQDLDQVLRELSAAIEDLDKQFAQLRITPRAQPETWWGRLVATMWREPKDRWRQRAHLRDLEIAAQEPRDMISRAETLLRELRRQPLETARKARELYGMAHQALDTAGALRAAGLRGESLDATRRAIEAHAAELRALPLYLLASTESQIVRRARPEEIIKAWEILSTREADIRYHAARLNSWEEAYTRAGRDLEAMQQVIELAEACLKKAYHTIDIRELEPIWEETKARAEDLKARYASATPEDLLELAQIPQITDEANRLIARLASLEALRTALLTKLAEHRERVTGIEHQLEQLASADRYPIDRDSFQTELDRLAQKVNGIGDPKRRRTPQELETDLATAQVLEQQGQALVVRLAEVREVRHQLIDLLDRLTSGPKLDWEDWAADLHKRTQVYDPENWLQPSNATSPVESLRVEEILTDAAALTRRYREWVPQHTDAALDPNTLTHRLQEVTALSRDIEAFEARLGQITKLLQQCQRTEETARANLESLYGALDRLDLVAADTLPSALSHEENHWTAIRRRLDEGYELTLALGNPGEGTVREKAERVVQWIATSYDTLRDWHLALNREIGIAITDLETLLEDLAAVAPLDDEPAVTIARHLLISKARSASLPPSHTPPDPSRSATMSVRLASKIAEQLRSLTQLDQAVSALRDSVITPLTAPVRQWHQARENAEEAFLHLQRLEAHSIELWPPVSCDVKTVQAQLELAKQTQAQLHKEGQTMPKVLALLQALAQQYGQVVVLVEERIQAYATLRPELDAALERLERWTEALKAFGEQHQDDPSVAAAVRARLDAIEAAWTQLHAQYNGTAVISGEEARRALKGLWHIAYRDLPIGSGAETIAVEQILRI